MDLASQISAVLGVPLAAVPVGVVAHSNFQARRPKSKLQTWAIRIEAISKTIACKGHYLSAQEMDDFIELLDLYAKARDKFERFVAKGLIKAWFGKGKQAGVEFEDFSRKTWDRGIRLSTEASRREAILRRRNDQAWQGDGPVATEFGDLQAPLRSMRQSTQPPTTSLNDRDHVGNTPSFSQICIVGSQYPSQQADTGTDNHDPAPAYEISDEVENLPTSELAILYNLWRHLPQEENPWLSRASLLDRLRGMINAENNYNSGPSAP